MAKGAKDGALPFAYPLLTLCLPFVKAKGKGKDEAKGPKEDKEGKLTSTNPSHGMLRQMILFKVSWDLNPNFNLLKGSHIMTF
jgi:hypothetical protein